MQTERIGTEKLILSNALYIYVVIFQGQCSKNI